MPTGFFNHPSKYEYSGGEKAFAQFTLSLILYLFLVIPFSNHSELSAKDYYALLFLGIGGTVIGHGLWVKVTSELPTQITSGIYYLVIPLSIIFEVIFLDFPVSTNHLIGSAVVLVSNLSLHYFFHQAKSELSGRRSSLRRDFFF